MEKTKALWGYVIIAVVLAIGLIAFSAAALSPWMNSIMAILAVLAAFRFMASLSVVIVGIEVVMLTIAAPLAVLVLIGIGKDVSLTSYLGIADLFQYTLPTITALVATHVIRRTKSSKPNMK